MTELHGPLVDGDLRLDPLVEADRTGLSAACAADQAIWQLYPISWDADHFDAAFNWLLGSSLLPYAIRHDGAIVGMTAYIGVDRQRGLLEIGHSYIQPDRRGTGLNRRIKQLMIDHAFAAGFRRIEFRVDARNTRSQAAVLKLGAVREGMLRAERITWTGHARDTVIFSILRDEWS